jgi:phosphohistidine phosphatase SixA
VPGTDLTSYLIRHAKAGSRERWTAPDEQRPLSAPGRLQARALAGVLGPNTRSIRSSPYLRCVETVTPLAEALGLTVEADDRLAEGADPSWALAELASMPGSVLCTHGDVMGSIVLSLAASHIPMIGGVQWGKAGTWAFDIRDGQIVGGLYLPPPD